MKNSLLIAAGLAVMASSVAVAQTSCPGGVPTPATAAANTKQQAADVFQYVAPQLAQALSGGSATLGENSTVGGLGHFSVGVRGNAVWGAMPDVSKFPQCYTGAYSAVLPTSSTLIPMPAADAAIGIFGGLPLALTNVGGLDLLVSAQYVPAKTYSGVSVAVPDGSLQLGYGARLGLLSESILVPGVSVSYLKRDLPRMNLSANTNSDSLFISGAKVKSSSWRLTASKSLILFGIAAGFGQDKFDSRIDSVRASVGAPAPVGRVSGTLGAQTQSLTRNNYFVDFSFNLLLAKLTAEVGQSTGGTVTTFNTFDGAQPAGARTYGSLGVRFGL